MGRIWLCVSTLISCCGSSDHVHLDWTCSSGMAPHSALQSHGSKASAGFKNLLLDLHIHRLLSTTHRPIQLWMTSQSLSRLIIVCMLMLLTRLSFSTVSGWFWFTIWVEIWHAFRFVKSSLHLIWPALLNKDHCRIHISLRTASSARQSSRLLQRTYSSNVSYCCVPIVHVDSEPF